MNWDMIGAVAELLGAVGVMGTLVYVALQMKTSNTASQVESKLRIADKMAGFQDLLIQYPELNEIMIQGRKGIEPLTKDQYVQFSNLALKACWFLSAAFFMYRRGAISEEDWHEFYSIASYWAIAPGFQQWWDRQGSANFRGAFHDFMSSEIRHHQTNIDSRKDS